MKELYIIKTMDGNRYETNHMPIGFGKPGDLWLRFPVNDGVGTAYVNIANIVCVIQKEVEDD